MCAVEEAAEVLLAVVGPVLPATLDVLDPALGAPVAVVLVSQPPADADSAEPFSAAAVEVLFASVAAGALASVVLELLVDSC